MGILIAVGAIAALAGAFYLGYRDGAKVIAAAKADYTSIVAALEAAIKKDEAAAKADVAKAVAFLKSKL